MATQDLDWGTKAILTPSVNLWWKQMIQQSPELANTNMVQFMKLQQKQGIYDYQKAIEKGLYPTYQEEHGQFRWDDLGKGKKNPNLDNKN